MKKKSKIKRFLSKLLRVLDVAFFIWRWFKLLIRWSAKHWQTIAALGSLGAAITAYSISSTTEGKVADIDTKLTSIQESIDNQEPQIVEVEVEVEKVIETVIQVPIEVPVEVIVESIKEVPVVKEVQVIVEKIIEKEIIKEVPIEVIVEVPVQVEVLPQELIDFVQNLVYIETYADFWDGDMDHGPFETQTDQILQQYNDILSNY